MVARVWIYTYVFLYIYLFACMCRLYWQCLSSCYHG